VEIYYSNGDYFWGDCVHGVKEGSASVVLSNGDNLMGRFLDGRLEGLVTETIGFCDRDNVTREVYYRRGVRHGFYREWGPSRTSGSKPNQREFWALGRFESGRKVGTHWLSTVGRGWLVGPLDQHNRSEGDDVVFLFSDLTTTIQGSYSQGRLVSGGQARLTGSGKEVGVEVPRAALLPGPALSYQLSNRFCITPRPLLADPYERRYIHVGASQTPGAGEGLWVKTAIPAEQTVAVFNGLRQRTLPGVKTTDKSWSDYRISCTKEIDLDINQVAESLANYRNTLAHKTCHSFTPNCYFQQLWHPYHGLVMSIVAGRALAAGEEVFVSYNYALEGAPTWYQALWFEHLRGEEGLTEAEVQDWVLRYQRRTGFCLEVPPPPRDSPRYNPCGTCTSHVGHNHSSISCSSCSKWFHLFCTKVNIQAALEEESEFTWLCASCQ